MITCVVSLLLLQGSVLDTESKLAADMELRAEAEPIGDVLDRISDKTGVVLKAAPAIKGDLIVLYAKSPVKDTLKKIEKHFDWTWTKTMDGYVLTQSPQQRAAEQKALQDQIVQPYLSWQRRSQEALQTTVPASASADLAEAIEENLKHRDLYKQEYFSNDKRRQDAWVKRNDDLESQVARLGRLLSPTWKVVDEAIAGLSQADLLNLALTGKMMIAYAPNRWQRRMGPRAAKACEALVAYLAGPNGRTPVTEEERDLGEALRLGFGDRFEPSDVANVRLTVKQMNLTSPGEPPFLQVTLTLLNRNGEPIRHMDVYDAAQMRVQASTPPPPDPEDRLNEKLVMTSELEALKPTAQPERRRPMQVLDTLLGENKSNLYQRHAKLMIEVAAAAKTNLVGDCYGGFLWATEAAVPVNTARAAFKTLARVASTWTFDGEWVSYRARHWQYRRATYVALENLRELAKVLDTDPPTLDGLARAIGLLPDMQIRNEFATALLARSPWAMEMGRKPEEHALARLWAALPPTRRNHLLSGGSVEFRHLNRQQQAAVESFLFHQGHLQYRAQMILHDAPYDLEGQSLERLKALWPNYGQQRQPGWDATDTVPSGIPPDARIGFEHSVGNALVVGKGEWSMKMTEMSALFGGYYSPKAEFLVKPAKQQRYTFTLWLSATAAHGHQLQAIGKGVGDFKPYSELDETTRKRLEEAYKKRHGGGN